MRAVLPQLAAALAHPAARHLAPALALVLVALLPPRAAAQACHMPALEQSAEAGEPAPRPVQVRTALWASFARFATPSYSGEYQGIHPSLAVVSRYVRGELALPFYRIVRNGLGDSGIGDLAIDVRAPLFDAPTRGLSAGLDVALTAPTGSRVKQLGMGHTMLMPGVFLAFAQRGFRGLVQLAYGRALGSMGAEHALHTGTGPLVNPMNRSELEHAIAASYALVPGLRVLARLYGATPVANVAGRAREALGFGGELTLGPVELSLLVELPLAGTPFAQRTLLGAAARF